MSNENKTGNAKKKKDEEDKKEKKIQQTLYLLDYMLKHSSVNHKISAAELMTALLDREFPEDTSGKVYDPQMFNDKKYESKVKRFLDDLIYGGVNMLGIRLIDCKYDDPKASFERKDKRYYAEGPLTEEQVAILRDAVCVYPYAEMGKTQEIVDALNKLTTEYNQMTYNADLVGANKYPGTYYENLQEIYKALSATEYDDPKETSRISIQEARMSREKYLAGRSKKISRVSFEYYEYAFNESTRKIELSPKLLKNGGIVRTVNPLKLLWSNGYYYLVTYYKDKNGNYRYLNYRVDRMKNVKCTSEPAEELTESKYVNESGFKVSKYKGENPVMYSSDEGRTDVVLRCKKYLLNNVLDTFGFEVKITAAPPDELVVKVNRASPKGVIMWALEYGDGAEIVEPASLREEMKSAAEKLLKRYNTNNQ
ncbi:MAG: WYL domain-containing protein [Oscillospiraceae bacterium]|nr:WYL domain-containing protein [Oscillospiraceae bacterium]MBQ5333321.1 WYL domain-containing protein [Oscillospiraceae bacterium]